MLQTVLGVGCDESECYEVRAEAVGFISNFVASFLAHAQHAEIDILDAVVYKVDSNKIHNINNKDSNSDNNEDSSEDGGVPNETHDLFSHEAVVHRRILFVLQQANFFSMLSKFLSDLHAAPVFLDSLMHLLWLLLCMDNSEVPQSLMREGIWPLLVDLLNLDNYWVRYRHCWTSFWKGTDNYIYHTQLYRLISLIGSFQIPDWAIHQWHDLHEVHISSTCMRVLESIRVVIYDDVTMRPFFSKNQALVRFVLDILLTSSKKVLPLLSLLLIRSNIFLVCRSKKISVLVVEQLITPSDSFRKVCLYYPKAKGKAENLIYCSESASLQRPQRVHPPRYGKC